MSKFVINDFMGELMKRCPYPENYVPPERVENRKTINININLTLKSNDRDKNIKPYSIEEDK